jgi:2-polyprenyl-6-methoxyphenol hydroxylase-like FAD-dependent oxidoreductase
MSAESVDVAVVGGGPGGLAAATAIKRVDPLCNVKVYERASELREVNDTGRVAI